MFHVNEAVDGMGTLTVENGQLTFHVSLQSQKIVNLYLGMAADAPAHEERLAAAHHRHRDLLRRHQRRSLRL